MEQTLVAPDLTQTGEQRIKMTYEEWLDRVDESKQSEWVDGEAIIFMPPKVPHQMLALFLAGLLNFYVRFYQLGEVLEAPIEMRIRPEGPSREPDILFVAEANRHRLTERRLNGPADVVIEFISNDSVTRDKVEKFNEYQDIGVPEYWLFDPRPGKETHDFWALDSSGRYRAIAVDKDGVFRSTVIPGFWFNVNWLWAEELPDPLATFVEIMGFSPEMQAEIQRKRDAGLADG